MLNVALKFDSSEPNTSDDDDDDDDNEFSTVKVGTLPKKYSC